MRLTQALIELVEAESEQPAPMLAPQTIKALLADRAQLVEIAEAAKRFLITDALRLRHGRAVQAEVNLEKTVRAYFDDALQPKGG